MKYASSIIGLLLLALGSWLLYSEPPTAAHYDHVRYTLGLIAVGLLLLVPAQIAAGISQVGKALVPFLPWGKKDSTP